MNLNKKIKGGSTGKLFLFLFLVIIVAGGVYVVLVFFEKTPPQVEISGNTEYAGKTAHFSVNARDEQSGLRQIKLIIRQQHKEHVLLHESFPRRGYSGLIGPETFAKEFSFNIEESGIEDGAAEIVLTARDYSLRGFFSGNSFTLQKDITIDTVPPKVRILHAERYIDQGGSGIVIYQIDGEVDRHGAQFAGHFHKGYPAGDGRDNVYLAFLAVPYNIDVLENSMVIAEDNAGNQGSQAFSPVFKKTSFKHDRINVDDAFLSTKIPEFEGYYPEMQGDMVEKYLYTNRTIRQANNKTIAEICSTSVPDRLWQGRFLRMAGASRAGFADHRTYFYQGREIDKQVHLGMDIASTRHAEVKAANKGKVVFADYLGIYGNMVILDHGQGIFSLYSHLSRIEATVGDIIDNQTVLGLTGTSGMAGGDHLHFSMLVNGIFVAPKEWWDQQWIEVTIEEPLLNSRF
jgi:murein DD-endopeptidase MepM/ murein hydrolase activator NlpD